MKFLMFLAAAAALSGCNRSVDDRFATFCNEQKKAGPPYSDVVAEPCKYGDGLNSEQKEQLMEIGTAAMAARERAIDAGAQVGNNGELVASDK